MKKWLLGILGLITAVTFSAAATYPPGGNSFVVGNANGGYFAGPDGDPSQPTYGFSGIAGLGMYRAASSRLRFATASTGRWEIDGNGLLYPMITGSQFAYIPNGGAITTNMAPSQTTNANAFYTNLGAGAGITFTLPNDPSVNVCYTVGVMAAQAFDVTPSAGESIRDGAATGSTKITSNTIGDTISVCATSPGNGAVWLVVNKKGTWTLS